MDYTENLSLIKPSKAEQFNIDYHNTNSDIIDAAFKNEVDTRIAADSDLQRQIDENRNEERRIGVVPVAKGGTGETAAQDALNALHGSVAEQADISADDEVTFIKRTAEDVAEGIPASLDVESVKLKALAQKVYDLMRGDTELFSATKNGLVPKAGAAGAAAFLSATGIWDNPSFSEDKIEVTVSKSYAVLNNTIFHITADSPVTVVLEACEKLGCTVTVINSSATLAHTLSSKNVEGNTNDPIQPNAYFKIAWNGSAWQNISAPAVGKRIIQFPQEESPDALYPCTKWEKIDYSGKFFRAEGGNANAFIEKSGVLSQQQDAIKSTTVSISGWTGGMDSHDGVNRAYGGFGNWRNSKNNGWANGAFSLSGYNNADTDGWDGSSGSRVGGVSMDIHHDHWFSGSTTIGSGSETRSVNYTVRVWKRIA